jgi:hypothetical protein
MLVELKVEKMMKMKKENRNSLDQAIEKNEID